MKKSTLLFIILIPLILIGCKFDQKKNSDLDLAFWDYSHMQQVKKDLDKGKTTWKPAVDNLIASADQAMQEGVYSVTYKNLVPPSGDKHDYMSMGPYWWPDPEKPDGLPYIRRDGEVNPERNNLDSSQLGKMLSGVNSLTLAWFFSGHEAYAQKAAELLRVWFLNPETLMNPHLEFGQSIPGRTTGRGIGIIDTHGFQQLVDAIRVLETSGTLTDQEKAGLKAWFEYYFRWLTESTLGNDEDNTSNNHATSYDVQVCAIAHYMGNMEFIRKKIGEATKRRIDPQIEADGSQPLELARTKSLGYSVANLRNFIDTGALGLKVGVDIFAYENPEGGSIQKALDYLIAYVGRESDWKFPQISSWESAENSLGWQIRRAAKIYDNQKYQQIWEDTFADRLNDHWTLLVTSGK